MAISGSIRGCRTPINANAVTDHGILGAVQHFMPEDGLFKTALRGVTSLATKDIEGIMKILVDAEMKMFQGCQTPVIFLQNVIVDMIMGIGAKDAFRMFDAHVREKYGVEPGYITMNMPALVDMLESVGIERPIVCSNINKIGFRTCGGLDLYREVLASGRVRAVAMSIYASGAIPPEEAIEWLAGLPNIESMVFGASSRRNIQHTRQLVDKYFETRNAA